MFRKKLLKKIDPKLCRVCGMELSFMPWGFDGHKPSYQICPCCGVEFGNDDATPTAVRRAREKWMKNGYVWFDEAKKPHGWVPDHQLTRLKDTTWDPWA